MSEPLIVPDSDLDFDSDLVFTLNGAAFTGIAYEETPELGRSEISHRDGLQEGPAREWNPAGVLTGESNHVQGVLHGESKDYDDAGRLVVEARYEYGILVWLRRFNAEGVVTESQELDPSSETGQLLARYRTEYGWAI